MRAPFHAPSARVRATVAFFIAPFFGLLTALYLLTVADGFSQAELKTLG